MRAQGVGTITIDERIIVKTNKCVLVEDTRIDETLE